MEEIKFVSKDKQSVTIAYSHEFKDSISFLLGPLMKILRDGSYIQFTRRTTNNLVGFSPSLITQISLSYVRVTFHEGNLNLDLEHEQICQ